MLSMPCLFLIDGDREFCQLCPQLTFKIFGNNVSLKVWKLSIIET